MVGKKFSGFIQCKCKEYFSEKIYLFPILEEDQRSNFYQNLDQTKIKVKFSGPMISKDFIGSHDFKGLIAKRGPWKMGANSIYGYRRFLFLSNLLHEIQQEKLNNLL